MIDKMGNCKKIFNVSMQDTYQSVKKQIQSKITNIVIGSRHGI